MSISRCSSALNKLRVVSALVWIAVVRSRRAKAVL